VKSAELLLYDSAGNKVSSYRVGGGATTLDFSNLNAGIYIWKLSDQGQVLDSGKVVKI